MMLFEEKHDFLTMRAILWGLKQSEWWSRRDPFCFGVVPPLTEGKVGWLGECSAKFPGCAEISPGCQVKFPPAPQPNIASQAVKLVVGERNDSYGNPADDYARTAKVWSGLLNGKLKPGAEITPKEATLMMAALKLCREMNSHKQDNLVDAIGYALLAEWIETGIKPLSETK